jgi:hypothetical protein
MFEMFRVAMKWGTYAFLGPNSKGCVKNKTRNHRDQKGKSLYCAKHRRNTRTFQSSWLDSSVDKEPFMSFAEPRRLRLWSCKFNFKQRESKGSRSFKAKQSQGKREDFSKMASTNEPSTSTSTSHCGHNILSNLDLFPTQTCPCHSLIISYRIVSYRIIPNPRCCHRYCTASTPDALHRHFGSIPALDFDVFLCYMPICYSSSFATIVPSMQSQSHSFA